MGLAPRLWVIRARLEDAETGETIDCRTAEDAARIGEALGRADSGDLPPEAEPEPPLGRYVVQTGRGGQCYLWRADGALPDRCFARTKSSELAQRVIEVLNRLEPLPPMPDDGTVKAGWF